MVIDDPIVQQVARANREASENTPLFNRENRSKIQFVVGLSVAIISLVSTVCVATALIVRARIDIEANRDHIAETDKRVAEIKGDAKATNVEIGAVKAIAEAAQAELGRRKNVLETASQSVAVLMTYDFKKLFEEHAHMWDLNKFGISNKEDYYRTHNYAPPSNPNAQPFPYDPEVNPRPTPRK
jgi:hypothetical protein